MSANIELRCQFCNRYLPIEIEATSIIRVRCTERKCKKWNNIKVVLEDHTENQLNFKFDNKDNVKCTTVESKLLSEIDAIKKEKGELVKQLEAKDGQINALGDELKDAREYSTELEHIIDGQR